MQKFAASLAISLAALGAACATPGRPKDNDSLSSTTDRIAVEEGTDSYIRVAVQRHADIRAGMCVDDSLLPSQEGCVEIAEGLPKDVSLSSGETETFENLERASASAGVQVSGRIPKFVRPSLDSEYRRSRMKIVHVWKRYQDWAPQLDDAKAVRTGLFVSGVQLGVAAYLTIVVSDSSGQVRGEGTALIVSLKAALEKGRVEATVNCQQIGAPGVCASIPARIVDATDLEAALEAFKAATTVLESSDGLEPMVIGYTIRAREADLAKAEVNSEADSTEK